MQIIKLSKINLFSMDTVYIESSTAGWQVEDELWHFQTAFHLCVE